MVCGATATNCGRNYEGLCLAPAGAGGACVGFAASKADGHLYCVTTADDGRLAVCNRGKGFCVRLSPAELREFGRKALITVSNSLQH